MLVETLCFQTFMLVKLHASRAVTQNSAAGHFGAVLKANDLNSRAVYFESHWSVVLLKLIFCPSLFFIAF